MLKLTIEEKVRVGIHLWRCICAGFHVTTYVPRIPQTLTLRLRLRRSRLVSTYTRDHRGLISCRFPICFIYLLTYNADLFIYYLASSFSGEYGVKNECDDAMSCSLVIFWPTVIQRELLTWDPNSDWEKFFSQSAFVWLCLDLNVGRALYHGLPTPAVNSYVTVYAKVTLKDEESLMLPPIQCSVEGNVDIMVVYKIYYYTNPNKSKRWVQNLFNLYLQERQGLYPYTRFSFSRCSMFY